MNHVGKQKGFTIIELMLAMSFVSVLLIAIAMTVIQISNIYNRGLTLKEVNQAGLSIASELQRSIAASNPFSADPGVGSQYLHSRAGVDVDKRYIIQMDESVPSGGRLCVGQYSYIWNYGKFFIIPGDTSLSPNLYSNSYSDVQIRFVKVSDTTANYCTADAITGMLPDIDFSSSVELLNKSQHDLAIHNFSLTSTPDTPPGNPLDTAFDSATGQRLYSIEFNIGTNDQNALTTDDLITGLVKCKTPDQSGADPAYCSVNLFDIIARASNAQ